MSGNDFCITIFTFTKKIMRWHWSDPDKKHVFLHLENKIGRPGHLCRTTALHIIIISILLSHYYLILISRLAILQFRWYCNYLSSTNNDCSIIAISVSTEKASHFSVSKFQNSWFLIFTDGRLKMEHYIFVLHQVEMFGKTQVNQALEL